MALDVYAPCPCGSGKKLKFCCATLADDMERITRQIESNQPRQALHQLETLDRKHPHHPWIATTRALVLIELREETTARDVLKSFLEHQPDHEFAIVLYATAVLQADGLDAAKKPIHRAFQRSVKRFAPMVSGLAGAMAALHHRRGQMLAAREHLALALRFAPDRDRQDVFVRLLEFDNDSSVPYLLRSVHPLPSVTGGEDVALEVKKAQKYAAVGCWSTAAEIFEKLATAQADNPALWHAVGLCRAWDGDEPAAATALHRAAQRYSDPALAVDCETIAQVFDWNIGDARRQRLTRWGTVPSVSRLLTALDAAPRLFRLALPASGPNGEPLPAAIYQVLDRPRTDMPEPTALTAENVAQILAILSVFDANAEADEPAELELSALAGSDFDTADSLVRAAAGEFAAWEEATKEAGWVPEETLALSWQWAFPEKTPVALHRRLENERWQHTQDHVWPNLPLRALGGKSPNEAKGDPSQRVALLSAVYVFEAHGLRAGHELDVPGVLSRLGIDPLPAVAVTPETSLSTFTPLQWLRLPLDQLTDAQMMSVVNRALVVHHDRFLYTALKAALQRPECVKELDLNRVYHTLADLGRQHGRREEAFHWLDAGRQHAASHPNSFEQVWSWDLRELLARLEDPTDPGVKPLLDKFVSFYSPKLPQMRPYLEQMLATAGLPSPWATGIVTAATLPSSGGLWTPDAPQSTAPAGKLWIPGS